MWIVAKNRQASVNVDKVEQLYLQPKESGCKVAARTGSATSMELGVYPSREMAAAALAILMNRLDAARAVTYTPTDAEVSADMIARNPQTATEQHYANGAKIRRHGGS